jgi:hypothetical protein
LGTASQQFASEPVWGYLLSYFWQTLPWLPFSFLALRESFHHARRLRNSGDRLLWVWASVPAVLVSLASTRNAHYLIYALPPWSIWAALGLARIKRFLQSYTGAPCWTKHIPVFLIALAGVSYAITFRWITPRFDYRGAEWQFYQQISRVTDPAEPLILVYDWPDWDRYPYHTPFGPMPHDLPVRLFYLRRPTSWCLKAASLTVCRPTVPFLVLTREHDRSNLAHLGYVDLVARGPQTRADRAYVLYRITPDVRVPSDSNHLSAGSYDVISSVGPGGF